jgi:hypothetical protein
MVLSQWRIGKDLEWSGRGLFWGTIPALAWRLRKTTKPLAMIDCLRAVIWTQDLPKTKQECQPLGNDVRWLISILQDSKYGEMLNYKFQTKSFI